MGEVDLDGTVRQVKPSSGKEAGNAPPSGDRELALDGLNEMSQVVREAIDGLGQREQRVLPFGVHAAQPGNNRGGSEDETAS